MIVQDVLRGAYRDGQRQPSEEAEKADARRRKTRP
jgi:hypothetical protein